LSMLLQSNDYVVADGPHRTDLGAKSVLDISDLNLLVMQLLVPTVRNAARIIEMLRDGGHDLDRMKLICNRTGRAAGSLSMSDVEDTLNRKVFASVPDDWATVSGAINLGEVLLTSSPKSKVRLAIQEIAERLHGPPEPADEKDAPKKGLIGRIFANT